MEKGDDGIFGPIATADAIAPDSLLKSACCNCKVDTGDACNTSRCSCIRFGFKCMPAHGECHGLNCSNSKVENEIKQDSEITS